jgi:hypothetical protein
MSVGRCKIEITNRKEPPMGTRNLTVVKDVEGKTRIALYGQWDGYPSYSGITALEFLRPKVNRNNLLASLQLVEFITDEESDEIYNSFPDVSNWENKDFLNAHPGLHRDTGVKILEVVATASKPIKTIDNSEFRNDELFCEGVYEVDFSLGQFITTYGGRTVRLDLDTLPTNEQYLVEMGVDVNV